MKYLLPLILVLAFVACVKEPLGLYPDVGVVAVTSDSVNINFNVPDSDTLIPGWTPWGSGEATKNMSIVLKETAKKNVHIEALRWQFYDVDGNYLVTDGVEYVPPIELKGGQDTTYTLTVTVWEDLARDLDNADGDQNDFSGHGTMKFFVEGYDLQRGEDINTIPSYTPMSVTQ